jgi:hypothetical protein
MEKTASGGTGKNICKTNSLSFFGGEMTVVCE